MTLKSPVDVGEIAALRLTLTGRVQGIGLRPAVARFAHQLRLAGHVTNTREGVEILIEGSDAATMRFANDLESRLPPDALVERLTIRSDDVSGRESFDIVEASLTGPLAARVPADVVVCKDCLEEVGSSGDRRSGYAFTSCTRCGPRYSIIAALPYERHLTAMDRFDLCSQCRREFKSAADRRFHAQTNACRECGPQLWCRDEKNQVVARHHEALQFAVRAIRQGLVVALRGLGGYQLIVDATNSTAVETLRLRKGRPAKPLAVMVESMDDARRLVHLDASECEALASAAGPIVILRARAESPLASAVSCVWDTVGLMLPTTPLHWLLLRAYGRPLVVTSGNREGEPLVTESDAALERLYGIADIWLEHDRSIRRPIDDSVVRVIAGRPVTIRLARGMAPLSLELGSKTPTLAVGGHQKVALALTNGGQAILAPHVGDMETSASRSRYIRDVAELAELYGADVTHIGCDLHPGYFTTDWAHEQKLPTIEVQHHFAHVVAGMIEHGWLDRRVLGVSFDGTGYGSDGTIWGGELLLADLRGFRRVGHLRPFRLAGGEHAVREPWRVALALVADVCGAGAAARLEFGEAPASAREQLVQILDHDAFSLRTTSAGRLFDGVAALALGIERSNFEGQPAMLLEAACDATAEGSYCMPLAGDGCVELDWRPMIQKILADRAGGAPPGVIAIRFHRGLADAIAGFCRRFAPMPVVLGGGVFQNRVLTELVAERLGDGSQPLGLPERIPPNDGGLAAGQLAVAVARQNNDIP